MQAGGPGVQGVPMAFDPSTVQAFMLSMFSQAQMHAANVASPATTNASTPSPTADAASPGPIETPTSVGANGATSDSSSVSTVSEGKASEV